MIFLIEVNWNLRNKTTKSSISCKNNNDDDVYDENN